MHAKQVSARFSRTRKKTVIGKDHKTVFAPEYQVTVNIFMFAYLELSYMCMLLALVYMHNVFSVHMCIVDLYHFVWVLLVFVF